MDSRATAGAVEAKKRKSLKDQSGVQVCSDITENSSRGKRKHIHLSEIEPKLEIHQTNKKKKNKSTHSSISNNNNESRKVSVDRKSSSKVSTPPRIDYILVRARRREATDSHSLAERVRREKMSERMKCLQDLVPGCNKITGKAGMLDEIIHYVQSLQTQVEFLSMKLATLNPLPDFISDNYYGKEILSGSSNINPREMHPEALNQRDFQFSPLQQLITTTCQGSIPEQALQGSIPNVAYSEPIFPNATPSVQESITWDSTTDVHGADFGRMDLQGRQSSFPFQIFGGGKECGV